MKEEKNIDNKIREKLENFGATPPPHIWNNVQERLAANKRKKRLMYIGWIAAAAVIVLAFLAGWYFNGNHINKNTLTETEITLQKQNDSTVYILKTETASKNSVETPETIVNPVIAENKIPAKTKVSSTRQNVESSDVRLREKIEINQMNSIGVQVAERNTVENDLKQNNKTVRQNVLTDHEMQIVAANLENKKDVSKSDDSWKMGMYVAPGYTSYSANYSANYSQQMTRSGDGGNANMSGGVSVQYKTGKRWIVESGVYYAQSGQGMDLSLNFSGKDAAPLYSFSPADKVYTSNTVQVENNVVEMNSTAGVIRFSGTPAGAELSNDFESIVSNSADLLVPGGQFTQVFQFMEVPLYLRYRVIDAKLGVELITGVNTGFVVGNNAYVDNQYGLQNIGQTEDISAVNFAGTLGVGLNYALGKHFSLAFEPRFSYYLNSINTNPSVDFRPYRIGFYTGVFYDF